MAREHTTSTDLKQRARMSMVVPAATMVAAWGVRKALASGYKLSTGHQPPQAQDRDANLAQVLLWTVALASAVAVAEVLVIRAVTHLND